MSETIYNQAHVAMSRILGRHYNNPLGEAAFPLLARLLAEHEAPTVLDAGCGRGQTAIWWAEHSEARVDAFDPSLAMLEDARERAGESASTSRIRFYQADFASYRAADRYQLILAHDVLCYSGQWLTDARRLAGFLAPGGILSVTDYYKEGDAPEVRGVLNAWGIAEPQSFAEHGQVAAALGLRALFHFDTTRNYREHWAGLRLVLESKRCAAEEMIGRDGVDAFAAQIDAILSAVAGGRFGHCWTIMEVPV